MKYVRILAVLAIALLGVNAFAQDFPTTFTTSDGLSIGVPEGFESQELMPGGAGVLDPVSETGVIVFFGAALDSFGLPSDVDAEAVFAALAELGGFEGKPAAIELANGSGVTLAGDIPDFGAGVVVAVDTDFGLLVGFIIARSGMPSDEFVVLANDIIGSVSFDGSAAAAPTEEPAADSTAEPTEEPVTGGDGATGEVCPIPVKDLPAQTVQFCLGAQFEYPKGWELFDGTETVDTYASLGTKDFGVTVSATVNELTQYFSPTVYKTDVVNYMADSLGDKDYDAATSWTTLLDEDGTLVEVYDPREVLDLSDSDVVQISYLVTLNNDLFLNFTFTYVPSFATEADIDAIEGIVLSTKLTDFYTGTPVTVEVNGEQVFVTELTCSDATYAFNFGDNGNETYAVKCPVCEGADANVWGTDIYTNDSAVCLAAAHAGTIDLEVGGLLLVTMGDGLEEYIGSESNGVTSNDYGTWGTSFSTAPFAEDGGTK